MNSKRLKDPLKPLAKKKPKKETDRQPTPEVHHLLSRIRTWRNDLSAQLKYDSAKFWADKIVYMSQQDGTSQLIQDEDVYSLAHIHFHLKEYRQCTHILQKHSLLKTSLWAKYLLCLPLALSCALFRISCINVD